MKVKWKKSVLASLAALSLIFSASPEKSFAETAPLKKETEEAVPQNNSSRDTFLIFYKSKFTIMEHSKMGASLVKSFPALHCDVVKVKKGQPAEKVMKRYSQSSKVETVSFSTSFQGEESVKKANEVRPENNHGQSMSGAIFSNVGDPKAEKQYYLDSLKIKEAAKLSGNTDIPVALIGDGTAAGHPDLQRHVLKGYNLTDPMQPAVPNFSGNFDTATHSAGIIAADAGNGLGGKGINPNATVLPIDIFNGGDSTSDYLVAEGILYAIERKAKVLVVNVGSDSPSLILERAVKEALDEGITVISPILNVGTASAATDLYTYPASYKGVIGVGGISKKKEPVYDTVGPSYSVSAPGEDIYSTGYQYRGDFRTFKMSTGSTPAAAIVAGTVTLMLSKNPALTPKQVKYILEQTANDLGPKGRDPKFGYGLIDPVKALSFPYKNLPAFPEELQPSQQPKNAREVKFKDSVFERSDVLNSDYAAHWWKADIKNGEIVQISLGGTDTSDLEFELRFFAENRNDITMKVNGVKYGKKEGRQFIAEKDGTLFIGIEDVFGHNNSPYKVRITKASEPPKDESTWDSPIEVAQLPFDSKGEFLLSGEEGDKDYFRYSPSNTEIVTISLVDLPGINTGLKVFDFEKKDEPLATANFGAFSAEEALSFLAEAGKNYMIEVNIDPANDEEANFNWPYASFVPNYEYSDGCKECGHSSIEPYQLAISGTKLQQDEDLSEPADIQCANPSLMQTIKGGESKTGYFQFAGDCDTFTFSPDSDGMFEWKISPDEQRLAAYRPYVMIKEWNSKYESWDDIAYLLTRTTLRVALKKEAKYLVSVVNVYMGPSPVEYTLQNKKIWDGLLDSFEPNNMDSEAKVLPEGEFTASLSLRGGSFYGREDEWDMFYIKAAEQDETYRYYLESSSPPIALPDYLQADKQKYLVYIVEDTNGNRLIDSEEEAKKTSELFPDGYASSTFRTKAGVGYFFIISNFVHGPWDHSYYSFYKAQVELVNDRDEDGYNESKYSPSIKPIQLDFSNGRLEVSGYLNDLPQKWDTDWYQFNMDEKGKIKINLEFAKDMNGQLDIYTAEGKLVAHIDNGLEGDMEAVPSLELNKGSYYIAVSDVFGNSSLNPYHLKAEKK